MYLNICTSHSDRRKNELVIETAWSVTLFSRPAAVPHCGVQPYSDYPNKVAPVKEANVRAAAFNINWYSVQSCKGVRTTCER